MNQDSQAYQEKKAFFDSLLTIFGRKPVLEALEDESIAFYKLHLASSNKPGGIIGQITELAERRGITIEYHDKQALSRISKNSKQDQGVAADIQLEKMQTLEQFLANAPASFRLIALDRITNPQNLGMIIRSVAAGNVDGLLLPHKGCAALSPLVIKASTGTLFKAPLLRCQHLDKALAQLKEAGASVCGLSSHATESVFSYQEQARTVYILGNETEGVSKDVFSHCDQRLAIPMANEVESLNVAITAALIAFKGVQ